MSELEQCGQLFKRDCFIVKFARIGFRSDSLKSKSTALQKLFRYWRPQYPEVSEGKALLTVFFDVNGPLFLNSSNTEGPLPPMCTLRQSKTYAGPSRTKDKFCLKRMWFCSVIMHVHTCPESHMRNGISLSGSRLSIYPIVQTCRSVNSRFLPSEKKHLKGQLFKPDNELKKALKDNTK